MRQRSIRDLMALMVTSISYRTTFHNLQNAYSKKALTLQNVKQSKKLTSVKQYTAAKYVSLCGAVVEFSCGGLTAIPFHQAVKVLYFRQEYNSSVSL